MVKFSHFITIYILFQANQYSNKPLPTSKGLASSFGFKKPAQTNKIRPISAPAKSVVPPDNSGSKMLPKPKEISPMRNTPSPNKFVNHNNELLFSIIVIYLSGLDSVVNQPQN